MKADGSPSQDIHTYNEQSNPSRNLRRSTGILRSVSRNEKQSYGGTLDTMHEMKVSDLTGLYLEKLTFLLYYLRNLLKVYITEKPCDCSVVFDLIR